MKNLIFERRKKLGLTQAQLGKKIDLSSSTISQIEANGVDVSLSTLKKLIDVLDCSPCDLFPDLSNSCKFHREENIRLISLWSTLDDDTKTSAFLLLEKISTTRRSSSKCALIIDDDELIRKMLEQVLNSSGYKTKVYASALDALYEFHHSDTYDIIITDNDMPIMSGTEFVSLIRKNGHSTPIIMISSKSIANNDLVDDFLIKPFSKQTILSSIDALV